MHVLKVLARGITASIALAALAAAGPALGGDPDPVAYSAEFEYGGGITFALVNKNPKVRDIEIDKISADCEGVDGRGQLDFTIFGKTPVLDTRRFAVFSKDPEGRGKVIVKGRFSRDFDHAKGTTRVYGSYRLNGVPGWTKCDSGKQKFNAIPSG